MTENAVSLVFTTYFDGRDGAGTPESDARNSDRNYLVQRDGTFTTYGNVMRDARTKWWSGFVNGRRVTLKPRPTRQQAATDLVALNPYGIISY